MDTTAANLRDDFAELSGLCESAIERLRAQRAHMTEQGMAYAPATAQYLYTQTNSVLAAYEELASKLRATEMVVDEGALIAHKYTLQDMLRTLQSQLGAVLAAGEWQSPSIAHTYLSQAGRETGHIHVWQNDYKRDRYKDASRYAKAFVAQYVEHPLRLSPHAYVTSSGMAAVLTTLSYLRKKMPLEALVLSGKSTYFQSKWILETIFSDKVHYIEDESTRGILDAVEKQKPMLVFLDTLSNNGVAMLDLESLLAGLSKLMPHGSTIVLDNTARSVTCQPLVHMPQSLRGLRLIVVESLSKYHQFGLDRVNGGIIYSTLDLSMHRLDMAHANSGTIMPDTSVHAQPVPNRTLLERRLMRIGTNAQTLAERLDVLSRMKKTPISKVIYPGLRSHPAYEWAKNSFCGGFFSCEFNGSFLDILQKERFLKKILAEAQKRGVPLVHGAGFGFNTTRLYIIPDVEGVQPSVLRVSVGTETQKEIDAIGDVFEAVFAH